MDKYEYKLKLDEIKSLADEQRYEEAAAIVDTINWRKVRNVNSLVKAGEVYAHAGKYEEGKEILLMAYDRSPIGRMIIYRLAEIAIKQKNFDEAQEYYNEFVEIAPHDNLKYVLRYEINKAMNAGLDVLIGILEELKEQEYTERWAFELAYLYHKAGRSEQCIEACDELILWFGDGSYVEKALELKMLYQPLSKVQEDKYRNFKQRREGIVEVRPTDLLESGEIIRDTVQIPQVTTNAGRFNTMNLQQELAKNMQQIMEATEQETVENKMGNIKKIVEEIPYLQIPKEGEASREEKYGHIETNEEIDGSLKTNFQELLGEEYDGQMSFVMPEHTALEKQITGQMNIQDVLDEWERTSRAAETALQESKQRRLESAKAKALAEAGDIMDRLVTVIPQLDAGMSPKDLLEQEYLGKAAAMDRAQIADVMTKYPPGEAGQMLAGVNHMLQKRIDELSGELFQEQHRDGEPGEAPSIETDPSGGETAEPIDKDLTEEVPSEDSESRESAGGASDFLPDVTAAIDAELAALDKISQSNRATRESAEISGSEREAHAGISLEDSGSEPVIPLEDSEGEPGISLEDSGSEPVIPLEDSEGEPGISEENSGSEPVIPLEDSEGEPGISLEDSGSEPAISIENSGGAPAVSIERSGDAAQEPGDFSADTLEWNSGAAAERNWETLKEAEDVPLPRIQLEPETMDPILETEEAKKTDGKDEEALTKLSGRQKEIFTYFTLVTGMESQLCRVLTGTGRHLKRDGSAATGNIIIQGVRGSGKTVLATSLVKALQDETGRPNHNIGKIDASALNQKNITDLMKKIEGGCLIIEKVGDLSRETAVKLSLAMEADTNGLLVIIEDTKNGIAKALGRDESFARKFTEKIDIPVFTSDELVIFAKSYAREMLYEIDDMAMLALYNRISNIQTADHITTLEEVKEIVDEAIARAEKFSMKKAFSIFGSRRNKDGDYAILHEKDFEV